MKSKSILPYRIAFLFAAITSIGSLATCLQAQFLWSERIASAAKSPEGEFNVGLALDGNDNCYVTGFFDGTNDFGGVNLTNQSTGGSDIYLAKYSALGALQWVQRAGGTSVNYGRAVGLDASGNIYVAGGYQGPADFNGVDLPATLGEQFFLAKYNDAGVLQWVQTSTGGSDDNYGIGLTVDAAGNSYALVVMDHSGTSITFGSQTVATAEGGTTLTILVKYDSTGVAQWAQLFDSSQETYFSKLAVDSNGNLYVRGTFESDMTIGSDHLSSGATKNLFIAKFNASGDLVWIRQPTGGNSGEGGVTVDPAGNVYISGAFTPELDFGGGITLTSTAGAAAPFGDAFLAKYDHAGTIQWARASGGASGGFYWDIALDAQTNLYTAGFLGYDAAMAKYSPAGILQSSYSAIGQAAKPVASLVAKCAVDSAGNCFLIGLYQGTAALGRNTLLPQEALNYFLAEVGSSQPPIEYKLSVTASPTAGGTVTGGGTFASGSTRTVTAKANSGFIFADWTQIGGVESTLASYSFSLSSNVDLVANFEANPFIPFQGTFNGLFMDTNHVIEPGAGFFTLTLSTSGGFTGKIITSGGTYSLPTTKAFDPGGRAQFTVPAKQGTLTFNLQLDLANPPSQQITGTVSDGAWMAELTADRAVFSATTNKAVNYEGLYTMAIAGSEDPVASPGGFGCATLSISPAGLITMAGNLADGTAMSESVTVSKDGRWPFYAAYPTPPAGNGGAVFGWLTFSNQPATALGGTLYWFRPAGKTPAVYQAGFTNLSVPVVGSAYHVNAKPMLALTSGQVTLDGGNLPLAITNQIALSSNGTVTASPPNTDKLALTINKATGAISGSFANPANPKQSIKVNGVVLQNQTSAAGYFLGTNKSGAFRLQNP